jgi:hypothetical protein
MCALSYPRFGGIYKKVPPQLPAGTPLKKVDLAGFYLALVSSFSPGSELELELIQAHMTQKPMLRVEVGARALRVLIKKMRLDGKGKCGCARHSSVGVDLWRASQGGMGM